jgi:hypothetical protein
MTIQGAWAVVLLVMGALVWFFAPARFPKLIEAGRLAMFAGLLALAMSGGHLRLGG